MRASIHRASPFFPLLLALAGLSVGCDGGPTASSTGDTTTTSGTTSSSTSSSSGEAFGPLGERADLPVDERIALDHLTGPVDVVRDTFGRPHIYAANVADAMRVQGYLVARDRTIQLEILRRLAEGRMAEVFGQLDDSLIDDDISFRHIGLHRVAKKQYAGLPDGDVKTTLDAFADGITQAYAQIRSGDLDLPKAIFGFDTNLLTDWTGADSLAVGRLQTYLLSYSGDFDVFLDTIFNASRATFRADSADPLLVKRAGFERDMLRFAPAADATTTTGYPQGTPKSKKAPPPPPPGSSKKSAARAAQAKGYLDALRRVRDLLAEEGFGSNNWGVSPSKSATGHTLIASDPHLNLTAPAIFYPVSIDVENDKERLKVGGVAFPGIPGIILGHNEHVAWGATVAGYDVSDAYAEELTPDGKAVKFNGKDVPLETIEEKIVVQGKADPLIYNVKVVPHHGPILPTIGADHQVIDPDPQTGAISIKWTGLEPTDEIAAIFNLLQAKNVDDAYAALQSFGVGAQNWMIGDTSGGLLWTSHARVPVRDPNAFAWDAAKYEGTLPCFILPGDGAAEWKSFLADDLVPWLKDPAAGYIATANNDPIGDTLDNDPSNGALPDGTPMYLASEYDIGFREERIKQRLDVKSLFTTDALASIQADHRSPMGSRVAPRLIQSIDRAEEERKTPGTHPGLTAITSDPAYDPARVAAVRGLLDAWGKTADYDAASGVDPETNLPLAKDTPEAQAAQATLLFNVWLVRVLRRTFGDEISKIGYKALYRESEAKAFLRMLDVPTEVATFDPATGESALWDDLNTPEIETSDERMIRALLDTLAWVDAQQKPLDDLRWGSYHTVRFNALIPLYGALSIPPSGDKTFPNGYPRPGDSFGVDSSDFTYNIAVTDPPRFSYGHGPAQRFVIDLDPAGPKAFNALPGGAVWDNASPHFADEAQKWRKNENHPVPFLLDDVIAAKESRTVITLPGG